MTCSNCGSSRLRRSKRSLGERVFLPILLVRPFRCEDCISRFYGWLWQSPPSSSSLEADGHSRVYQSSTAALHSAGYHMGRIRRKIIMKGLRPFRKWAGTPVSSWLSKPISAVHAASGEAAGEQRARVRAAAAGLSAGSTGAGHAVSQLAPEILGVIPERKNEGI